MPCGSAVKSGVGETEVAKVFWSSKFSRNFNASGKMQAIKCVVVGDGWVKLLSELQRRGIFDWKCWCFEGFFGCRTLMHVYCVYISRRIFSQHLALCSDISYFISKIFILSIYSESSYMYYTTYQHLMCSRNPNS